MRTKWGDLRCVFTQGPESLEAVPKIPKVYRKIPTSESLSEPEATTLLKRRPVTDVFLRICEIFHTPFLCWTSSGKCFWNVNGWLNSWVDDLTHKSNKTLILINNYDNPYTYQFNQQFMYKIICLLDIKTAFLLAATILKKLKYMKGTLMQFWKFPYIF